MRTHGSGKTRAGCCKDLDPLARCRWPKRIRVTRAPRKIFATRMRTRTKPPSQRTKSVRFQEDKERRPFPVVFWCKQAVIPQKATHVQALFWWFLPKRLHLMSPVVVQLCKAGSEELARYPNADLAFVWAPKRATNVRLRGWRASESCAYKLPYKRRFPFPASQTQAKRKPNPASTPATTKSQQARK